MHPGAELVSNALIQAGAAGRVVELDQPAATAAAAAAALHCPIGAIANSLVFVAQKAVDGSESVAPTRPAPDPAPPSGVRSGVAEEPVLVLVSGAHRVDTVHVARLLQVDRLRAADPEVVRRHTGQSIGGVAPVGHPTLLRTLVDVDLAGHPVVWAAAGHPHAVFPTTFEELVRLTAGTPADVARSHSSSEPATG